ncbi:hypothetical protein IHE45_10G005000 [Dioscorea alata]|uniref:Uncharacterized protein n=1 Tax=Dioscorea alata TaxID=55571 RepID=A0ACB7V8P0_DIOAL|nr:hypothetical protein IHE45_10G005000 [Dioscorea alata]
MERGWQSVMKMAMVLLLLLMTIGEGDPIPRQWPERFHAVLLTNLSDGRLQITNQWYDWPAGRNTYLRQFQLGDLLHDVEWNNGISTFVMKFEEGVELEKSQWQAPSYCFKGVQEDNNGTTFLQDHNSKQFVPNHAS